MPPTCGKSRFKHEGNSNRDRAAQVEAFNWSPLGHFAEAQQTAPRWPQSRLFQTTCMPPFGNAPMVERPAGPTRVSEPRTQRQSTAGMDTPGVDHHLLHAASAVTKKSAPVANVSRRFAPRFHCIAMRNGLASPWTCRGEPVAVPVWRSRFAHAPSGDFDSR